MYIISQKIRTTAAPSGPSLFQVHSVHSAAVLTQTIRCCYVRIRKDVATLRLLIRTRYADVSPVPFLIFQGEFTLPSSFGHPYRNY